MNDDQTNTRWESENDVYSPVAHVEEQVAPGADIRLDAAGCYFDGQLVWLRTFDHEDEDERGH